MPPVIESCQTASALLEWGCASCATAALNDCLMNASLGELGLGPVWRLHTLQEYLPRLSNATTNVHAYWRRQAHRQVELPHALFFRWHQETQSQLFDHLLQLWPSDVPRTMVDLGCHAGHSEYYNTSDALRWLLRFHHPGSHVVGVDAVEDYALDLQHRFDDVEPFRSMTGVRKQALALAISRVDGETDTRGATSSMVNCCFGFFCGRRWDNLEREGVLDHMCRIARQRVGLGRPRVVAARAAMPLPNSSQPNERAWRLARRMGQFSHPFRLRSVRLDTLWREALGERHIDFIKVDVDMSWAHMGMEGLLQARGFSVMTIEVDATWGGISAEWGVTAADQLAWLAARHGYRTLLKVACHGHDAQDRGFARYVPLCASQCLNRAPRSAPPLPAHRGGLAPPAHAAPLIHDPVSARTASSLAPLQSPLPCCGQDPTRRDGVSTDALPLRAAWLAQGRAGPARRRHRPARAPGAARGAGRGRLLTAPSPTAVELACSSTGRARAALAVAQQAWLLRNHVV